MDLLVKDENIDLMFRTFLLLMMIALFQYTANQKINQPSSLLLIENSFTVDGWERHYLVSLPANHKSQSEIPLIYFLHGGGGSAKQAYSTYHFAEAAHQRGYAVVFPDGVKSDKLLALQFWNAGNCCKFAVEKNIDDKAFISQLADTLKASFPNLSTEKYFVTGMSNGAMMSYRLACELPEEIAAIAPVAGTMVVDQPCNPSQPVPVLHIHAENDSRDPLKGGTGVANINFPSAVEGLAHWRTINGCDTNNLEKSQLNQHVNKTKSSSCQAPVTLYLTDNGGHSWPGGEKAWRRTDEPTQALDANKVILDFFDPFKHK